jgi:hypothetical protein
MRTTTHHRTVTTLVVASVVTVLAAGCGQGPADRRARELEDSTAEVVSGARAYAGDPWERRSRERHNAEQHSVDGWEHRLTAEHDRRVRSALPSTCH